MGAMEKFSVSCTVLQVEVREENYSLPGSEQMQVSLLVNQLSVNFTKGERFTAGLLQ